MVLQCFPFTTDGAMGPASWFATVTGGRLKTWSTNTGEVINTFTDEDHLDNNYTAVAAVAVQKKKSKKQSAAAANLVALGTDSGSIIVWRTDLGEVVHRLGGADGHTGQVNCLHFNVQGTMLYSGGDDHAILEWSLADGTVSTTMSSGKGGVNSLCVHRDGVKMLSASSSLQLWDLTTHKVVKKFAGHTSMVGAMAFSDDASHFISGANDRFVSLWSTATTKKKREKTCVHSFTMDHSPRSLSFNKQAGKGKKNATAFVLGGVSAASTGFIWRWDSSDSSNEPTTEPSCRITLPIESVDPSAKKKKRKRQAAKASQPPITEMRFVGESNVLVARADGIKPSFHTLSYGGEVDALVVPVVALGALLPAQEREEEEKALKGQVNVMESTPSEMLGVSSALTGPSKRSRRTKKGEVSLEEQLQTLKQNVTDDIRQAGSLQTVLQQALHTNDVSLVGYCLRQGARDEAVIKRTVARLPIGSILPLLTAVTSRYKSKPNRGVHLLNWIKNIINTHTSYLMTVPELSEKLNVFHHCVNQRLSVFNKLLALNGRLELVINQATQVNQAVSSTSSSSSTPSTTGPYNLYDPDMDNSDSEEEETHANGTMNDDDDDEGDDEGDEGDDEGDDDDESESDN